MRWFSTFMDFYIPFVVMALGFSYFTQEVVPAPFTFSYLDAIFYPAVLTGGFIFITSAFTNIVNDTIFSGDEDYDRWREEGRDSFIDLISPRKKSERSCPKCSTSLPHDWSLACYNCGYNWGASNWNFECNKCGVRVPMKKGCWNCDTDWSQPVPPGTYPIGKD